MDVMGMKVPTSDHIHTLHRSPFMMAPIIHAFYSELKPSPNNILFSYLVLPLVLHEPTSAYLYRLSTRSNWRTMISDKTRISGVHRRIQTLREITNVTIMSLESAGYLEFDENLAVKPTAKKFPHLQGVERKIASARKLARILEDREPQHIYKSLGIAQL